MKKTNLTEKKLKFHCSVCFTLYQLVEIQQSLKTKPDNKCLNNCLAKWESLLIKYCQARIILDMFNKEQEKEKKEQKIAEWISEIKKKEPQ